MDSLKFVLPNHLRRFVDLRIASDGYTSIGEYLRELIRLDQRRWIHDQTALMRLEPPQNGRTVPQIPSPDDSLFPGDEAEADSLPFDEALSPPVSP